MKLAYVSAPPRTVNTQGQPTKAIQGTNNIANTPKTKQNNSKMEIPPSVVICKFTVPPSSMFKAIQENQYLFQKRKT